MKLKTSVTLSEDIVKMIDKTARKGESRSEVIERLLRETFSEQSRRARDARDLELINKHADELNKVICAPIYSQHHGLSSQIPIGIEEGVKHESSIHCDELISLPKSVLTQFVGRLSPAKLRQLDRALVAALGIDTEAITQ